MTNTGKKLASLLIAEGRLALASEVYNFEDSMEKLAHTLNEMWYTVEHRCPKCNKAIVDPLDYEYCIEVGECLSCDHSKGDL